MNNLSRDLGFWVKLVFIGVCCSGLVGCFFWGGGDASRLCAHILFFLIDFVLLLGYII